MSPLTSIDQPAGRASAIAEWGLVIALLATFVWTTLCLGGFMAHTMAVSGPMILGLGAGGALLWGKGQHGRPLIINRVAFVPLPFLLFVLVNTLGWAPAAWLAWTEWLLWFQMWLVFFIVLHFGRSRAHTWAIVSTFALLAVAGVGMAIYQRSSDAQWMMLGRKQAAQFAGRSSGMFGIPNSFAGLLELIFPVCASLLFSRTVRPGTKIMCGWLGGLCVVGLALAGSRGGWLSLTLAMMVWPLLATRKWKRKVIGMLAVLSVVSGGLWALYHGNDHTRQRLEPFLDGRLELSRPQVWSGGVNIWADHPWLGAGAGSFNVLFDAYRPERYPDNPVWAHNDYLNTLADHGLVGFVLWAGAGLTLFALGWLEIRRSQRASTGADNVFGLSKWKLGLWLGLLAFALHLFVDFHTKIPALAYAAAIAMALLLRDAPAGQLTVPRWAAWLAGGIVAVLALALAVRIAAPLYRAEGLRAHARLTIDRYARNPEGALPALARDARAELMRAVRIDETNAQAWADLAYALVLAVAPQDRAAAGHVAELAADRALALCPLKPEFWVRKGAALDLQLGRPDAEACYRKATQLAPRSARWWYYYAFHLQTFPERMAEARQALATCLALDPHYPPAERLRQRFSTVR